jgi:hypothetical protein
MAFANASYTDVIVGAIESRRGKIADNVTKNNALLTQLKKKGRVLTVSGGSTILEELSFAENGNAGFYSGYDQLPTAQQDVLSAAQFSLKQAAVPVSISGLEKLQNSGKEEQLDLMEARLGVAESTLTNIICQSLYGDGTGYNGKSIVGLDAAVEATVKASQTSTYGGISRSTWSFWRSQCTSVTADISTATKVQTVTNALWAACVRGGDMPDFGIVDNNYWADYMASLQAIQRFTSSESASLGFPTIKYMTADLYLDGGIGGFAGDSVTTHGTLYLLNSKYLKFRPHKDRNFVALDPSRRYAVNQDAEVAILGFAGALTCSGAQFNGRVLATTI